jgi:hypothetical protein
VHSPECDAQLHDALTLLLTTGLYGENEQKDKRTKEKDLLAALSCIRRRLLMYGAKIP